MKSSSVGGGEDGEPKWCLFWGDIENICGAERFIFFEKETFERVDIPAAAAATSLRLTIKYCEYLTYGTIQNGVVS